MHLPSLDEVAHSSAANGQSAEALPSIREKSSGTGRDSTLGSVVQVEVLHSRASLEAVGVRTMPRVSDALGLPCCIYQPLSFHLLERTSISRIRDKTNSLRGFRWHRFRTLARLKKTELHLVSRRPFDAQSKRKA